MNKLFGVVAIGFLIISFPQFAMSSDCNERKGMRAAESRNLEAAFSSLASCESSSNVSGKALRVLAMLYGSGDFDDMSDEERLAKVWTLLHQAAGHGDRKALSKLVQLYEVGEPILAISPSPNRAQCLSLIVSSGTQPDIVSVKRCVN